MKSQACSGSGESPVAGTMPGQCPSLLSEVSEAWPLKGLPLSGALPRPPVNPVWVGQPRGEGALVELSLLLASSRQREAWVTDWVLVVLSEVLASQCLCLGQVPSFAIFLVRCGEPGRTRGTLFGNGVWGLRGCRGVSGASCSPQHGSIVDVDVASDGHRPAVDVNAVGAVGHLALLWGLSFRLPGLAQRALLL